MEYETSCESSPYRNVQGLTRCHKPRLLIRQTFAQSLRNGLDVLQHSVSRKIKPQNEWSENRTNLWSRSASSLVLVTQNYNRTVSVLFVFKGHEKGVSYRRLGHPIYVCVTSNPVFVRRSGRKLYSVFANEIGSPIESYVDNDAWIDRGPNVPI